MTQQIDQFVMTNAHGMEVHALSYGGIINAIRVPDRNGQFANVVLGLSPIEAYQTGHSPYFGALIGRYGNRIRGGTFTLDGKTYTLDLNNGKNSLHGGKRGFDKQFWTATPTADRLELHLLSANGDEGYPGNLLVRVVYTLTDQNELRIEYTASTDQLTVVNLTNHSYFNLAGNGSGDMYQHQITINADHYTPVDETLIPTGQIASVEGTPFDFRVPKAIGQEIRSAHPQMVNGSGYDHNFVLNRNDDHALSFAARAHDPQSGRTLEVFTTEPGVQFYSGNHLTGALVGSSGGTYRQGDGFCFEAQHFPDSPNQPNFPSTTLAPGEIYESTTVYKFSVG